MKIIDCETKGNVVRFYLGKDDLEKWWGDDWNDRPYEHNAGMVYDEYVSGKLDIAFNFDDVIVEPNYGHNNSPYCKEDFINRKAPCLVVVKSAEEIHSFEEAVADDKSIKIYFGDSDKLLAEKVNGK